MIIKNNFHTIDCEPFFDATARNGTQELPTKLPTVSTRLWEFILSFGCLCSPNVRICRLLQQKELSTQFRPLELQVPAIYHTDSDVHQTQSVLGPKRGTHYMRRSERPSSILLMHSVPRMEICFLVLDSCVPEFTCYDTRAKPWGTTWRHRDEDASPFYAVDAVDVRCCRRPLRALP